MANIALSLDQKSTDVTVLLDQRDQMSVDLGNAQLVYTGLRWETEPTFSGMVKYNPETKKYSIVKVDLTFDPESSNLVMSRAIASWVESNFGKIKGISLEGTPLKSDANGNIDISLPTNVAYKDQNNNFSTSQTINGTLTINGDIVQNGSSYETHAEQVFTKDDTIILREGAVGGLGENEYAGLKAKNYDGQNTGVLVFGSDGIARVGDEGDTQPLLTREETSELNDGDVLVWNSETQRAEGASNFVTLEQLEAKLPIALILGG